MLCVWVCVCVCGLPTVRGDVLVARILVAIVEDGAIVLVVRVSLHVALARATTKRPVLRIRLRAHRLGDVLVEHIELHPPIIIKTRECISLLLPPHEPPRPPLLRICEIPCVKCRIPVLLRVRRQLPGQPGHLLLSLLHRPGHIPRGPPRRRLHGGRILQRILRPEEAHAQGGAAHLVHKPAGLRHLLHRALRHVGEPLR